MNQIMMNNNWKTVYISLGSNLGESVKTIKAALKLMQSESIKLIEVSKYYKSEPWGKKDQNYFVNCVAKLEVKLSPWKLLAKFQEIEKQLGKDIKIRWGERTIDIDIVLFDQNIIYEKFLIIPHPRYHKRNFVLIPLCGNFVLIPLCDISNDIFDPLLKKTSGELLKNSVDNCKVELIR